jgi:hypothetical protein
LQLRIRDPAPGPDSPPGPEPGFWTGVLTGIVLSIACTALLVLAVVIILAGRIGQ